MRRWALFVTLVVAHASGCHRLLARSQPVADIMAIEVQPIPAPMDQTRIRLQEYQAQHADTESVERLATRINSLYMPELMRCDWELQQRRPAVGGPFVIAFSLTAWGMVSHAQIGGFDTPFNRCVSESVRGWRFAPPRNTHGEPVRGLYALLFEIAPNAFSLVDSSGTPGPAETSVPAEAEPPEVRADLSCPEGATLVEDGELLQHCVADGKRHGPYVAWYETGPKKEERYYLRGMEHGRWTRWYANGDLMEQKELRSGAMHGLWINWYRGGQKASQYQYRDGRSEGTWTNWCENGEKYEERNYEKGKVNGPWTTWYQTTESEAPPTSSASPTCGLQKASQITYRAGKRSGIALSWHRNGKKAEEGAFRKDHQHGKWSYYDQHGEMSHVQTWRNGKLFKRRTYSQGKANPEEFFKRGRWVRR